MNSLEKRVSEIVKILDQAGVEVLDLKLEGGTHAYEIHLRYSAIILVVNEKDYFVIGRESLKIKELIDKTLAKGISKKEDHSKFETAKKEDHFKFETVKKENHSKSETAKKEDYFKSETAKKIIEKIIDYTFGVFIGDKFLKHITGPPDKENPRIDKKNPSKAGIYVDSGLFEEVFSMLYHGSHLKLSKINQGKFRSIMRRILSYAVDNKDEFNDIYFLNSNPLDNSFSTLILLEIDVYKKLQIWADEYGNNINSLANAIIRSAINRICTSNFNKRHVINFLIDRHSS